MPFGILDNCDEEWCRQKIKSKGSAVLNDKFVMMGSVSYTCETGVQELVKKILEDIVLLSGHKKYLDIHAEASLPKVKYLGGESNLSDFWLVCTNSGRPIMVAAVKSPHNINVLDDPRVKGQIADYMLDVMSFFGQHHIFGITSTMKDFMVHWFPHSNEYATATTLSPKSAQPMQTEAPLNVERSLCSSKAIAHTDRDLVTTLVSVLQKSWYSPYNAVPLIHRDRTYVQFDAKTWQWVKLDLSAARVAALSYDVTPDAQHSTSYAVVKYFDRSSHSKVWLTIAQPSMQIVVMKLMANVRQAQAECDLWHTINDCEHAYVTTVNEKAALCMPLALHADVSLDGHVTINYDLSAWSCQRGAVAGPLPPKLQSLSQQLQEMGKSVDLADVAMKAIQRAAAQKVVHTDLEWRHIAVLPRFSADGATVEALQPVLLDFGQVDTVASEQEAHLAMTQRLDLMKVGCIW